MEISKKVLVSYLDRNKIIQIPSIDSDELVYLKKEFRSNFCFGENVNIDVTFQKFDPDWNDYIDLESPLVLAHKDKLKAIVTPLLRDSTPSGNSSYACGEAGQDCKPFQFIITVHIFLFHPRMIVWCLLKI